MHDPPICLVATADGDAHWRADLKTRIHRARQRAALAGNHERVRRYWPMGRDILTRQAAHELDPAT